MPTHKHKHSVVDTEQLDGGRQTGHNNMFGILMETTNLQNFILNLGKTSVLQFSIETVTDGNASENTILFILFIKFADTDQNHFQ